MQHFYDIVMSALGSVDGAAAIVAVVVEFGLRLIKSEKPLSILHGLGGSFKMLGTIFAKAGDVLDKILPQNVAADPQQIAAAAEKK